MKHTIKLKKNEDRRLRSGHLWVFSNEIQGISGEPEAGEVVGILAHTGDFIGTAFYNPHSLIAARLLSRENEEIDFQFFRRRIEAALQLRRRLYPDGDAFRVVHGESDFLPGLVVDKFADYLSIQTFSSGMDRRLTLICDVLNSLLHPKGIVERNEAPIRTLEGLPQKKGLLRGTIGPVTICENDLKYRVDLLEGQKTGFFLDQRENRLALRRYVKGSSVLDCFCNDGGFALNAAYASSASVVGVEISADVVSRAQANAGLNRLEQVCTFLPSDAFEFLKTSVAEGRKFDVVNLDPPSFAKSKKTVVPAKRGYKEIHTASFGLLPPGGILSTSSCSHHISDETFLEVINKSALAAGRRISLLEWRGAPPDHPILPAMPETKYLKFGIFRVE